MKREPHKIMTPEEYENADIIDWHEVCRNYDGFGAVAVRYIAVNNSPDAVCDKYRKPNFCQCSQY